MTNNSSTSVPLFDEDQTTKKANLTIHSNELEIDMQTPPDDEFDPHLYINNLLLKAFIYKYRYIIIVKLIKVIDSCSHCKTVLSF